MGVEATTLAVLAEWVAFLAAVFSLESTSLPTLKMGGRFLKVSCVEENSFSE